MLSLPTHVLALALACVVGITATPHPAPFGNPDAATTTDSGTSQGTATSTSASSSLTIASALPPCAEPAFLAAVKGSSCQATDVLCICSSARLFPSLMSAVQEACDPADQAAIVAFAGTWCGPSAVSHAEAALTGSMTSSGRNSSASMTTSMSYGSSSGGKNLTVVAAHSTGMNSTGGVSTKTTSSKAGTVVQSANETNNYSGAALPQGTGSSFLAFAIAVLVIGCFFAEF